MFLVLGMLQYNILCVLSHVLQYAVLEDPNPLI